jgi:hypothetical protein
VEEPSNLLPLLLCAAILLCPLILFGVSFYLSKRRIRKLEEEAKSLGLSFNATGFKFDSVDDPTFLEHLPPLTLFTQGTKHKVRNVMTGEREGVAVTIFDYRFRPALGGNRNVWTQTVILLERKGVALPAFEIRPRSLIDRLGGFIDGEATIDAAPGFSKKYVVQGPDLERVAAVFGSAVRAHFEAHAGTSCAGEGDQLIYYRLLDQKSVAQMEPFLNEALELAHLMGG